MMTCEENDGESKKLPLGESDRDDGVSVWPVRVKTSERLRRS